MNKIITQVLPRLLAQMEIMRQVLEACGFDEEIHAYGSIQEIPDELKSCDVEFPWTWTRGDYTLSITLMIEEVRFEQTKKCSGYVNLVLCNENTTALIAVLYRLEDPEGWILETDGLDDDPDLMDEEREIILLRQRLPIRFRSVVSEEVELTEAQARDIMSQLICFFMKSSANQPAAAPPTP